jgi:hypothetical protein
MIKIEFIIHQIEFLMNISKLESSDFVDDSLEELRRPIEYA